MPLVRPLKSGDAGEALGLPMSPDELHDGEEPPVAAALLPLLQHQLEEEAEASLPSQVSVQQRTLQFLISR